MRWVRAFDYLAVAVVGVSAVTLGAVRLSDHFSGRLQLEEPRAEAKLITRGAYLADLADCTACHSIKGQPRYTGGLPMKLPIGTIYTPNITPDVRHGIGAWTLGDFDRLMRLGIARGHGMELAHTVYPAMPYTSYASMPPDDIRALWAYFRHGVKAEPVPTRRADILWPLSMRFPLTIWRWAFAPPAEPYRLENGADAEIARGAYIVDGPGHCGECHTSRGIGLQLKAQTASAGNRYLAGARVGAWYAPSLRSEGPGTLEEWTAGEIAEFLRTGVNRHSMSFGSMNDVVEHSTQHMTDGDLLAIGKYLKTLGDPTGLRHEYEPETAASLMAGNAIERGAQIYIQNCGACHRSDGRGYAGVFPPLTANPAVEADDALSLMTVVLQGSASTRTGATPAKFTMPPFDWRLDDEQIADVISFIRAGWGNRAGPITARMVAKTRKSLERASRQAEQSRPVDPSLSAEITGAP